MVTVSQYQTIIDTFSLKRKAILVAHYKHGPFDDSVQLAEILDYPNSNSVNLQIGMMGKNVSAVTGYVPNWTYVYKGSEKVPYFSLIHRKSNGKWHLLKNVRQALERLKLVDTSVKTVAAVSLEFEVTASVEMLLKEGKIISVFVNKYERDKKLREACLKIKGNKCYCCEQDFKKKYGSDIEDIIHVHHIRPLSQVAKEELKSIDDLVPLCPNCHSVVHSVEPVMDVNELKLRVQKNQEQHNEIANGIKMHRTP